VKLEDWPLTAIGQPVLTIILTGISSLAVAIVTQLGLGDLAKARENGRIGCGRLVARAQLMFAQSASEAVQSEKHNIMDRLFQLEQQQADLFAALGHPPTTTTTTTTTTTQQETPPPPSTYGYGSRAIGPDF
jgi:hypothetical protein